MKQRSLLTEIYEQKLPLYLQLAKAMATWHKEYVCENICPLNAYSTTNWCHLHYWVQKDSFQILFGALFTDLRSLSLSEYIHWKGPQSQHKTPQILSTKEIYYPQREKCVCRVGVCVWIRERRQQVFLQAWFLRKKKKQKCVLESW